jgi:HEAT repeat protein
MDIIEFAEVKIQHRERSGEDMGVSIEKIESWKEKGKVDKIIKAADGKNKEASIAAIKALGSLAQVESVNYLIQLLRHSDADIRFNAVEALGNTRDPRGMEFLRYSADNEPDEKVKEAAKEAMKKTIKKY